jgi:serine/threonine protein phosphatase PrpC
VGVRAALWGTDHEQLDQIATATAGDRAALALTRGRHAKAYRYEDPNEDAVAVVAGPRATLLVCADGHNGATASHVAVREVLGRFGDNPPPELSDGEWLDLFGRVNEAVLAAKGVGSPHPVSNTVLIVALAANGRLSYAAIGDAALVAARPGAERGRQLNKEVMRFIGQPMSRRALKGTVQRGTVELAPGDWVVAVTDGLSEFIAPLRPADVLPRVLGLLADASPEPAALAVAEAACSAGAGDNVGVVVLAPA